MNRSLFRGSGIGALSLAILGHEVDSEDAYEKLITETTDYFIEILKEQWNWIKDQELFKEAIVGLIKEFGLWGALAVALAGLLLITVDFFVALWAPADLIIQDSAAFTALDLAMLTSANFPPPSVVEYTTPGDIDVKIEPIRKDVQYIERRTYSSDSEDSKYRITLRYNRF
jgi:hypothetical protein